MQEIECIRGDGAGALLDNYLKKLIKESGHDIKLSDHTSTGNNKHPLILITNTENLTEVINRIESRNEKIIIAMNSRKDFKLITELKSQFSKIFGFIDLSQEIEYNIPVLKNYMTMHFAKGTLPLDKLAGDLDKIYEFTKSELTKIKDLHDRFVKVRIDKLKGMSLTSKFMAGEKSGGEFFEILQNEHEVVFIQAGSDSYLLTSILLGEIETLKEKALTGNLTSHSEQFIKTINHHATETKGEVSYCIMSLNLRNLNANFTINGECHLFYEDEWLSFDKPMQLKLKPKARLCLISNGAFQNWNALSKKNIENFFKASESMPTRDLVNEFFFEVSRNKHGSFLIYDALMAVVDIEESKLYQI
jgi:hypothetical protein